MLDFKQDFCYYVVMKTQNYNFDTNEEVIVTVGQIVDIVEGIAELSKLIEKPITEMPAEQQRKATITLLALFTVVARLFPSKQRKMIFEDLKTVVGVDLTDILWFYRGEAVENFCRK